MTTIFIGADVVWDPRPGTAFDHMSQAGDFDAPEMQAGRHVDSDLFPVVNVT